MLEKSLINILVVDDDPASLTVMSRILSKEGFISVATFDNGIAALASLQNPEDCNQLILMDLNMPNMDGIEFAYHLVNRHYKGSLILVSGMEEDMQATVAKLVSAYGITVLGHLHKPVQLKELLGLIDEWRTNINA